MKSLLILLFVALSQVSVLAAFGGHSFVDSNLVTQAAASLVTFRALITPANYNLMGFHSTNDLLQATNAEPVQVYAVGLDQLRNYHPGQHFDTILESDPQQTPARRVIVPIMVGTNVRSSITLRLEPRPGAPQQWTNANWGQPKLIRDLMATYRAIPNTHLMAGTVPFAVEIPVFKIWFVGYYNPQSRLILRSTVDLRLGSSTINRTEIVTEDAMRKLATAAQRYNGLPN